MQFLGIDHLKVYLFRLVIPLNFRIRKNVIAYLREGMLGFRGNNASVPGSACLEADPTDKSVNDIINSRVKWKEKASLLSFRICE